MKEGLEKLNKLQQIEDKIVDIKNIINEIPRKIRDLEKERDGKKKIIENAKEKLNSSVKFREKFEKDISLIREKISKYREQLNKSTTNREYQGFISEIKYEEEKILSIEEKIIEEMLHSDEIMDEIREREKEFNSIAEDYNKKIDELNHNIEYHRNKLDGVKKDRKELREKTNGDLLDIFDYLLSRKNGKAVSAVETDFCGICNVKVRPQRLSELITTGNIFYCENCGRLLYKIVNDENSPN